MAGPHDNRRSPADATPLEQFRCRRQGQTPFVSGDSLENWGAGFSALRGENPQASNHFGRGLLKSLKNPPRYSRHQAGASLALHSAESVVLRAAVLPIVLTLALGPNAAVLCTVWCHPQETQSSACQQEVTASPRVTGEDRCRTLPAAATALVREEAKRGTSMAGVPQVVSVSAFLFAPPSSDTAWASGASTSRVVVRPALLIALRI
jgi:hypothetical protein